MLSFLLLVFCGAACALACREKPFFQDAGPLVSTGGGKVVGKYVKVFDTDVAAFLGVPFAEPPLGGRRFMKPEPARPWSGLLLAHDKPSPCMQYSARQFAWMPTTRPSEDCLYLNVWAPARRTPGESGLMPVMVWIHGGAFTMGSTDMEVYDGSVVAAYGEVVVVSMNYRLGAFGFLNAGTDSAPGNAGMHDQLLAIKWVKDNIAQFGGDPDKVTLFGESAGAMSISMHLISPLSRGLFLRAILQSGTMYQPAMVDPPHVAKHKVAEFAKLANCDRDDDEEMLSCFKGKGALELAQLENTITQKSVMFFLPSFGNEFLPKAPVTAYEAGDLQQADVLLGIVRDEGTLFLPIMAPEVFRFESAPRLSPQQAESVTRTLFQLMPKQAVDAVVSYYFQNATQAPDEEGALTAVVADALGDAFFNCPTALLAEKLGSARVYWLTHGGGGWMGVHHFSEVPFVFGAPILDSNRYSPEDGKFSGDLIRMWAEFARTGEPLGEDKSWPRFSREQPVARELNPRSSQLVTFPRFEACDALWRRIFVPPQPIAQENVEVVI